MECIESLSSCILAAFFEATSALEGWNSTNDDFIQGIRPNGIIYSMRTVLFCQQDHSRVEVISKL